MWFYRWVLRVSWTIYVINEREKGINYIRKSEQQYIEQIMRNEKKYHWSTVYNEERSWEKET